ncbi:LysR family transcriptional regulator [Saxibacter everestensis]|uniref:LysR family transcriptional regulator n=1 Tax=Saxibacter everestensis TaxID=2909229 RepID=A0ABY8QRD3_9MICO|nr:LysR family transcriptional regulator [Brevibacteriaceae bacterium ZFBP1038]
MIITLRQLEYFAMVADQGTVTAAAQQLYLSQSAVSNAIADLERLLDVKLFVRHARGLSLTREGRAVLSQAQFLLRDAADLERNAAILGDDLSGTLSVGCYSTIAPLLLPRVVADFATKHPGVDVQFAEGSRSELLEDLTLGRYDVLVLYDYRFKDDLSEIGQSTPLGSIPPYALLPPEHRLTGCGPVALADLAADPLILFGLEPADQYFLSLFELEGLTPNVRYRTGNYEVLRGLVARGVGYSLLTQRTRQTTSYEGLAYSAAELEGNYEPLGVIAVTPSRHRLTRRVDAFVNSATAVFAEAPTYDQE